jgi:uncharacterized protein
MTTFELTLVLTHACDMACTYCSAGPKDSRRMEESLGRRSIARALAGLDTGDTLSLGFFGGEPLLEWATAKRLLAHARELAGERGIAVQPHVTTNGTHLDDAVADELIALGFDVAVSFDGLPEVHDAERRFVGGKATSSRVLDAIDRLVARGAPPRVVSVVRPSNVERLAAGARFLVARGVTALHPSLDYAAPWRHADVATLAAAVSALGALYAERFPSVSIAWFESKLAVLGGYLDAPLACEFGRGEIAVAPSGRTYPCGRLVTDDRPGKWVLGHVDDGAGPFAASQASCVPRASSACGGCAVRFACSNSCACANIARTGSPDQPDGIICALEQASLDATRDVLTALAERAPRREGVAVA